MTPREEFTQAGQHLTRCQRQLDEARGEYHRQRREVQRALPRPTQAEEDARLKPLMQKVREQIAQVDEAKQFREQKYAALPDKSEADGWL